MKLYESLIAWGPEPYQIKIGLWPDRADWSKSYAGTSGGCWGGKDAPYEKQVLETFKIFNKLVAVYKIDPELVHEAFLEIDEYRENCSPGAPSIDDDAY